MRIRQMILAAALIVFGLATAAHAQTTTVVAWDYVGTTPTTVAMYQQTLTVDGVPATGAPTCAVKPGAPGDTQCTLAIPALSSGSHVLTVTAAFNGVSRGASLGGLNLANGPTQPSTPRVSITVTITVP